MTSRLPLASSRLQQLTRVGLYLLITTAVLAGCSVTPAPESEPTVAPEALNLAQSLEKNSPEKKAARTKKKVSDDTIDPKAIKPEVSFIALGELSADEWLYYAELEANAYPVQLGDQTIFLNPTTEAVEAVWKSKDQLLVTTFPSTAPVLANPYLNKFLSENPSDLKAERPLLIELAPINDEDKERLRANYLAARVAIPFLITKPADGAQLAKVIADEEPGKYQAHYLHEGKLTVITVYHLITYKEGRYGHIKPDDIFGNEDVTIDGVNVFQDEASLYWRSDNLIYDFPLTAYQADQPHTLISAFLKQNPPGGY